MKVLDVNNHTVMRTLCCMRMGYVPKLQGLKSI